ncbi:hypothetical protein VTN02DRAFT_5487 [Thermoascus thermophilus]
MSFLISAARETIGGSLARRSAYVVASASFHSSAARSTLKEDDRNRDGLHEEYEVHKQDQLRSSKDGRAKWKQELASNSEASIKADRGEIDASQSSIESLQQATKDLPNRDGPVNRAH